MMSVHVPVASFAWNWEFVIISSTDGFPAKGTDMMIASLLSTVETRTGAILLGSMITRLRALGEIAQRVVR